HARLFYIDRSCRTMMAGKALQVEKSPREVERHIDRTHGVPAIQAAMGGDHGIEQLAHLNVPCFPEDARRSRRRWPLGSCTRTSRDGVVPALERDTVVGNG